MRILLLIIALLLPIFVHAEAITGKVVGVSDVDANLQQVRDGMAWWYKAYQKE